VVAGLVVLAAVGAGLWLFLRGAGGGTAAPWGPSPAIPSATVQPEGLGGDPLLDRYARECHDGDMAACDTLYREADPDSDYKMYGGTCAGRQAIEDAAIVYCADAFPAD
jgi:hypothetical protein